MQQVTQQQTPEWPTIIFIVIIIIIIIIIYPLTARVGGAQHDFATSFLHFSLFSTALWDLANSWPVHSLMPLCHLLLCLPCLLSPFTVPCKMVLARPDERKTCSYHCSLRIFTVVKRSSCGPIACWISARTSSLVTWCIHTHTHTHTHEHMKTGANTCIGTQTHIHKHKHTHAPAQTHTHTHKHT